MEKGEDRREGSLLTYAHSGSVDYLIARGETTGLQLPHALFHLGKEVLPVFSLAEAARRFLASLALGGEWHVRTFSAGELVSLLFILHERVAWVVFNTPPRRPLGEDVLSHLTTRDGFVEFSIAY